MYIYIQTLHTEGARLAGILARFCIILGIVEVRNVIVLCRLKLFSVWKENL